MFFRNNQNKIIDESSKNKTNLIRWMLNISILFFHVYYALVALNFMGWPFKGISIFSFASPPKEIAYLKYSVFVLYIIFLIINSFFKIENNAINNSKFDRFLESYWLISPFFSPTFFIYIIAFISKLNFLDGLAALGLIVLLSLIFAFFVFLMDMIILFRGWKNSIRSGKSDKKRLFLILILLPIVLFFGYEIIVKPIQDEISNQQAFSSVKLVIDSIQKDLRIAGLPEGKSDSYVKMNALYCINDQLILNDSKEKDRINEIILRNIQANGYVKQDNYGNDDYLVSYENKNSLFNIFYSYSYQNGEKSGIESMCFQAIVKDY